jgi:hypothetical protein
MKMLNKKQTYIIHDVLNQSIIKKLLKTVKYFEI